MTETKWDPAGAIEHAQTLQKLVVELREAYDRAKAHRATCWAADKVAWDALLTNPTTETARAFVSNHVSRRPLDDREEQAKDKFLNALTDWHKARKNVLTALGLDLPDSVRSL